MLLIERQANFEAHYCWHLATSAITVRETHFSVRLYYPYSKTEIFLWLGGMCRFLKIKLKSLYGSETEKTTFIQQKLRFHMVHRNFRIILKL